MANPRVTFRCPPDLYAKLPDDERERSALILALLQRHYEQPQDAEQAIAQLQQKVKVLETAFAKHFMQ